MMKEIVFDTDPKTHLRQDRLNGWLAELGVTWLQIARASGTSQAMTRKILIGCKPHDKRTNQLADLDIPRVFCRSHRNTAIGQKPSQKFVCGVFRYFSSRMRLSGTT